MFQYEIIHNILPTQISLYRDGFSDSDVCPLCHHEQQTLSHLLVTCIKTASFWQTFQVWWYEKTGENLLLNQGKILYGFFENTAHWQALNYLIVLAKYHIFCTNGHEDEICFQSFLLGVKEKLTILNKEIAVAKKTITKVSTYMVAVFCNSLILQYVVTNGTNLKHAWKILPEKSVM